jgi:hypothetical protein
MNATTVVLPYNETASYDARLRVGMVVSKFEYALELLTEVPALKIDIGYTAERYQLVSVPVSNIALAAAAAPVVTSSNAVRIPAAVDIAVAAPVPTVGSGIGSFVSVPGAAAITIGAVAPTTTTSGTPTDPDFANVSLLLHMDGSNGSTTFTDSSSNALTVTANGGAQISTAQSKFGGASGLFDGSGDYLVLSSNTNFSFSADFTVELWIRQSSAPTDTFPIAVERGNGTEAAGTWGIIINNSESTKKCEFFYGGPRTYVYIGDLAFDTWHFVAVTRSGSTLKTFIDGDQTSSVTVSDDLTVTADLRIGSAGTTSNYFKGNLDDLRITKGVARYTASFTPPTAAFLDS